MSWNISGSVIRSGYTKYYWPGSQPQGFDLQQGETVRVDLELSEKSAVTVGLTNGDCRTIDGTSITVYLYTHSTGYGKLYIKNLGSRDITVWGTIETDNQ